MAKKEDTFAIIVQKYLSPAFPEKMVVRSYIKDAPCYQSLNKPNKITTIDKADKNELSKSWFLFSFCSL